MSNQTDCDYHSSFMLLTPQSDCDFDLLLAGSLQSNLLNDCKINQVSNLQAKHNLQPKLHQQNTSTNESTDESKLRTSIKIEKFDCDLNNCLANQNLDSLANNEELINKNRYDIDKYIKLETNELSDANLELRRKATTNVSNQLESIFENKNSSHNYELINVSNCKSNNNHFDLIANGEMSNLANTINNLVDNTVETTKLANSSKITKNQDQLAFKTITNEPDAFKLTYALLLTKSKSKGKILK